MSIRLPLLLAGAFALLFVSCSDEKEAEEYIDPNEGFEERADETDEADEPEVTVETEEVTSVNFRFLRSFGELGIATPTFKKDGVAFSGPNIVTFDTNVYDLNGDFVGNVNLEGITGAESADNFQFTCMTNDPAGNMVAVVGYGSNGSLAANSDAITNTEFWMWPDGWDSAPTRIRRSGDGVWCYVSVSGDVVNGPGLLNYKLPREGSTGQHQVLVSANGSWSGVESHTVETPYPTNDGNGGQALSFVSADPDDYLVLCDSQDADHGMHIMVREGINGTVDTDLKGTVSKDKLADAGGDYDYGVCTAGFVRAFQYGGRNYVACATTSWPATYLTIQTLDPNDEDHYLLRTIIWDGGASTPAVSYYQEPESGNGYVVVLCQSYSMLLAEIETTFVPVSD